MELIEQTQKDKDIYNHFIASQPGGSFLQAFEWGQWQERLGRTVHRYFLARDGHALGAAQVVVMPIGMGKYYLYLPYGPVGRNDSVIDVKELAAAFGKKFPKAVALRIEPKEPLLGLREAGKKTVNIQPAKTLVVNLQKETEQLLKEMHHKTRYNIKVAQKHGVQVVEESGVVPSRGVYSEEALSLIAKTAGRHGYTGYGEGYYHKLVRFFAENEGGVKVKLYKALLEDRVLASGVMVDFGQTRTYLFGGSSDAQRNVMAPYLLHWQAMVEAKSAGMKAYDFWGIETSSGDTPGFVRFKLGFAPQQASGPTGEGMVEYPGAYDIVYRRAWYALYGIMRKTNRLLRKKNK